MYRGPGAVSRRMLGVPEASPKALGKTDQVQGVPFGEPLGRQKVVGPHLLMEILGEFQEFHFSTFSALERSRGGLEGAFRHASGAQGGSRKLD